MLSSATRRRLKYSLGADVIDMLVRFTPVFDGTDRPPEVINFAGHKNFIEVGDLTVELLRKHAGLREGDRVLDIGCAIARNALALHRAYGTDVVYDGFDIVPYGIRWSEKHFRNKPGRYTFAHADIFNTFYNPRGNMRAEDFDFPYADDSFDVSVATSVYTHMRKASVARYFEETARTTRPGGRAYFTCFGRDGVSEYSAFSFEHAGDGDWIEDPREPDMAVAHDMDWVRKALQDLGATDIKVFPGYWRGGKGIDYQDVVVVTFGAAKR